MIPGGRSPKGSEMKFFTACLVAGALAAPGPALAQSEPQAEPKPKAEVIAWDEDGRPDRVRIDDYEYKLCKGGQTDSCINPQDAGFDWGGKEIHYWPGRPASEIDEPLPEFQPGDAKDEPPIE